MASRDLVLRLALQVLANQSKLALKWYAEKLLKKNLRLAPYQVSNFCRAYNEILRREFTGRELADLTKLHKELTQCGDANQVARILELSFEKLKTVEVQTRHWQKDFTITLPIDNLPTTWERHIFATISRLFRQTAMYNFNFAGLKNRLPIFKMVHLSFINYQVNVMLNQLANEPLAGTFRHLHLRILTPIPSLKVNDFVRNRLVQNVIVTLPLENKAWNQVRNLHFLRLVVLPSKDVVLLVS